MSYRTFVLCNSPYIKAFEIATAVFACLHFGYGMSFWVSNIISIVVGLISIFLPPTFPVLVDGIIVPGIMVFCAIKLFLVNHIGCGLYCVVDLLIYEILRKKILRLWRLDPETALDYANRYINH